MKKKLMNFLITKENRKKLKALTKKKQTSMSELLNRMIEQF